MRSREISVDPQRFAFGDRSRGRSLIEELMSCPPGVEPEAAIDSAGAIRILLDEALQHLETYEREHHRGRMRFIFESTIIERRSLREVGRDMQLSKTHVARVRDQALHLLREDLITNPHIQEALNG